MGLTIRHWVLWDGNGENRKRDPLIPDTKKGSPTSELEATQLRMEKLSYPSSQIKKSSLILAHPFVKWFQAYISKTGCQRRLTYCCGYSKKNIHLPISQVLSVVKGPGFFERKDCNVTLLCQAAGLICMALAILYEMNSTLPSLTSMQVFFLFLFLGEQDPMSWLAWNSPCRPGQCLGHRGPPISTSYQAQPSSFHS